jgi:hypothetical protein
MNIKQVAAASALALSALPVLASITSEGVTYSTSYMSLGGDDWALTLDIDATANTFNAAFLTAVSIVPGGDFSNVTLFSASDGTWSAVMHGPTSSSSSCGDVGMSSFCVAATNSGASVTSPIEMVFHFTDAGVDLGGPHVQVSWDVNGHHLSEVVPVPEPSTYALLAGGLGVIGWMARRRRTR